MEFFALLAVATAAIAILTVALYRKRRDVGFLVGAAALYYWTLYGAWYIVIDKTGGFSGKNYHYLEYKLFPISLDGDYMLTLALYSGFLILVLLTLLLALSRDNHIEIPRLVMRHEPILIIAVIAALASLYIIKDKLSEAWALNTSAYTYTRQQTGEWFTLHQVLNRVAMLPPAIGFATLLAGKRSRFFVNVVRRYTWPGYIALFLGMAAFTFVLGNKNEVFMSLIAGLLCYLASVRRPSFVKAGLIVIAGMWFLYAIDFFRGTPISEMSEAVSQRLDEATEVASFVTSSNEAYAAHFSLYGVLSTGAEPRFGYSLYSLACSVVPRVLWPDRPADIYNYYADSVGAIQNQGYSVHHATGWYLNFGYAGVAVGALVMGLVWAWCSNAHQRIAPKSGLGFRLFATIAPWLFVACLPPLIRAGPEGYKGFVVEGLLIPMATLGFACRAKKAKPKLYWDAHSGWTVAEAR
ncbi:MAG TPA: hypothetical protein VK752_26330 [Bryobacteraceae bacterium]|jgi:hypothetical protein|nr:hypothetical protein [Bryobacteraceae bacterium]